MEEYRVAHDFSAEQAKRLIVPSIWPSVKLNFMRHLLNAFTSTVDAKSYWKQQISKLETQLEQERGSNHPLTRVAFVTFTSVAAAQQSAQTLHNYDTGKRKKIN